MVTVYRPFITNRRLRVFSRGIDKETVVLGFVSDVNALTKRNDVSSVWLCNYSPNSPSSGDEETKKDK